MTLLDIQGCQKEPATAALRRLLGVSAAGYLLEMIEDIYSTLQVHSTSVWVLIATQTPIRKNFDNPGHLEIVSHLAILNGCFDCCKSCKCYLYFHNALKLAKSSFSLAPVLTTAVRVLSMLSSAHCNTDCIHLFPL